MKNAFDGPIRRLDTAGEKKIYELGYINRNPKTKKVKRKKTENNRTEYNCGTPTKEVPYMKSGCQKKKKEE